MNTAYLALGSNVGNKRGHLDHALDLLAAHPFITLEKVASYIDTPADSSFPQPDYLNTACLVRTLLNIRELFEETRKIERVLGRTQKGTGMPRTCDIDILLYNDDIVSEDDLVIPHPLMHERLFVLQPLVQIAPQVVHPLLQETILSLYTTRRGY